MTEWAGKRCHTWPVMPVRKATLGPLPVCCPLATMVAVRNAAYEPAAYDRNE